MPTFQYTAVQQADGRKTSGSLEALSRSQALQALGRMGLRPLKLEDKLGGVAGVQKVDDDANIKLKPGDLILFTEELADLLEAGLPLEPALRSMENRDETSSLTRVTSRLRRDVCDGTSLGVALRRASPSFDDLYCNLATAGEASGALPAILRKQAEFLASSFELRRQFRMAMIYPAFLMVAGITLTVIVVMILLPELREIFESSNQAPPAAAQFLMNSVDFIGRWWWLMLFALVTAVVTGWQWTKSEKNRPKWDAFQWRIPLFGSLLQARFNVQLSDTLSNLVGNGLPLMRALELTRNTFANLFVRAKLDAVYDLVADGASFSGALRKVGGFAPALMDMVSVGEHTGDMKNSLQNASKRFERELANRISMMQALVQPVIICLMAVLVGSMVYLMITAIFDALSSVSAGM